MVTRPLVRHFVAEWAFVLQINNALRRHADDPYRNYTAKGSPLGKLKLMVQCNAVMIHGYYVQQGHRS